MPPELAKKRHLVRRLIASRVGSNPRLKRSPTDSVVQIFVDFRPGVRPADVQSVQLELEQQLHVAVELIRPASLAGRERAAVLHDAVPL